MLIYLFTNKTNGKQYVGQTVRDFKVRLQEHLRKQDIIFDKALNKYGIDNFEYDIIDQAETIEELNAKEIFWINKLNSITPNGYNQCCGGENTLGFKHREDSRRKMSLVKRKKGSMKGKNNHYYGKKHSPEVLQKMKDAWTEERKQLASERSKAMDRSYLFVKVKNVDTGEIFNSVKEAAAAYGLKDTHISKVCKGKGKTTGGFRWEYVKQSDDKTIPSQAAEEQKV